MRYVQFMQTKPSFGVQLHNGDIVELGGKNGIPNNLVDFIKDSTFYIEKAKRLIIEGSIIEKEDVDLLAPLTNPDKVICVGLNYKSHCEEQKKPFPKEPFFFNKFPSTIIGPYDDIIHPPNSNELDWEVELGVVIGKKCRQISIEEADDYIFGYTVCQDISARDWQSSDKNNGQFLFAKSMDTFCPLGPTVVSKDEVQNPKNLRMACSLNGTLMQEGNTNDMIHDIHKVISFLSSCITLLPGDVILTGTPSGVGAFRVPQIFLKPGDIIESEIDGIGKLQNKIVSFSE